MAQSHLQITLNWAIKQLKKPKAQRQEINFTDKPVDISLSDFKNDLRFIVKFVSKVYKKPMTPWMLFTTNEELAQKILATLNLKANGISKLYYDFKFSEKDSGFICKTDPSKILVFDKKLKSIHIVKFLYDNLNKLVTTKEIAKYVSNKINGDYSDAKVRGTLNNNIIPRFTKAQVNMGFPFDIHNPGTPVETRRKPGEVGHKGIMMRKLTK